MAPTLIALAGASRSGKGTCASVFREKAGALGLTSRERQLSGPGKQYVASAFRPDITEEEAIAWFEEMKKISGVEIMVCQDGLSDGPIGLGSATLQEYLQRMLQGARDRWGTDFWTDKLLPPLGPHLHGAANPLWCKSFQISIDERSYTIADLCLISDLRQANEARRVKLLGGLVIELYRPVTDDAYVTGRDHITEQRLPDDLIDLRIQNDGDLDKLSQNASWVFDNLLVPRLEQA